MSHHAEVAFVSDWGPDHQAVRSFVSQLLEFGVDFEHGDNQQLLRDLPDDLDAYEAVIFDKPAFNRLVTRGAQSNRLEKYITERGLIYCINDPVEGTGATGYHCNILYDVTYKHNAQDLLAHTRSLKRFSDGMMASRRAVSDDKLIGELIENEKRRALPMRDWSEMNLHHWKAIVALIELAGQGDLREPFTHTIREASKTMREPVNHDVCGGYFATGWLYRETGDRGPLDQATAYLDDVIAQRPRHEGVIIGCGYGDDPLGMKRASDDMHRFFLSDTINRREVIWNEGLHLYGPAFAGVSRATGDPKYLDEMLRYFDRIRQFHVREDGLINHASSKHEKVGHVWGRGQLHALLGMLYMLDDMDRAHPKFDEIIAVIDSVGHAIMDYQDGHTGLWRNVINHPEARLEASCTAGYGYVYARGVRERWLDRATYEPMLRSAWNGLKLMYWRGGLGGNCRGTGVAADVSYYLARPQGYSNGPPSAWMTMFGLNLQRL